VKRSGVEMRGKVEMKVEAEAGKGAKTAAELSVGIEGEGERELGSVCVRVMPRVSVRRE